MEEADREWIIENTLHQRMLAMFYWRTGVKTQVEKSNLRFS
jgi:hypothetical protein